MDNLIPGPVEDLIRQTEFPLPHKLLQIVAVPHIITSKPSFGMELLPSATITEFMEYGLQYEDRQD